MNYIGLDLLYEKKHNSSYPTISWNLEATRLVFRTFRLPWYLASIFVRFGCALLKHIVTLLLSIFRCYPWVKLLVWYGTQSLISSIFSSPEDRFPSGIIYWACVIRCVPMNRMRLCPSLNSPAKCLGSAVLIIFQNPDQRMAFFQIASDCLSRLCHMLFNKMIIIFGYAIA